jgi:NADP-dependent 3-hydroxy acid dehydrogenase YdfG|tara:strand:- start:1101 stop:1703 length:603 start_codon:yes stop_codon:yes gene_type:complete
MKYLISGTTSGIGNAIKKKLNHQMVYEINRDTVDLNEPKLVEKITLPIVDCAILNAGHDLGGGVPFVEHNSSQMLKVLNCNLVSNVLLSQKILRNNPKTILVLVTSTNVNKQYPNDLAYNITKLGMKNLYDLIKIDYPKARLKEARIGLTKTEFNNNRHKEKHKPINDLYTMKHMSPEYVAESILYLIESEADFWEINGE